MYRLRVIENKTMKTMEGNHEDFASPVHCLKCHWPFFLIKHDLVIELPLMTPAY